MPRTVVIIEDDEDVRGLIEGILAGAGLEVQAAPTGAAGVEAVRKHGPDIIVVDFGLPDYNGTEAIRRIREFSQAPVLMLTGHGDLAESPYEAGVNDVMAKPFSPSELRRRVENCSQSRASPKRAIRPQVDPATRLGRNAAEEAKLIQMFPSPSPSRRQTRGTGGFCAGIPGSRRGVVLGR